MKNENGVQKIVKGSADHLENCSRQLFIVSSTAGILVHSYGDEYAYDPTTKKLQLAASVPFVPSTAKNSY
jgi:hypothetical protein